MRKRRLMMSMFGVAVTSGALVFACSDDKPATTPPITGNDSGGAKDTGTADQSSPTDSGTDSSTKLTAVADIKPTSDASTVTGTATFTEENGEVTVVVNITNGIPPGDAGMHGLHIHQNGSCDPSDAGGGTVTPGGGAGGHWNPADAGHGLPTASPHHLGDMGNISISDPGTGTLTLVSKEWTVSAGPSSVVGHAVIFHAQPDDGVSQPVGNAGARPGCGVVVAK